MTSPKIDPRQDEIARVAHAIWEAEGQPQGRDHDHWMRAKQLITEGRAEVEYPAAIAEVGQGDHAPRAVQPGFEDVAPGMVPNMKSEPDPELQEAPGGRFAKQLADLPDASKDAVVDHPGPRNPAPLPPTGKRGFVTLPSVEDEVASALSDDPTPPNRR